VTIRAFYTFDLADMGSITVDAFTQHNITNEFQATPDSELQEDVGDFGDPEWIGTFDTSWRYQDFLVSHRIRWQNAVKIDSLDQTLYSANYTEDDDGLYSGSFGNKTDARFIHDLSVSYTMTDYASVQVNIQNLLDRKPDGAGRIAFAAGHFGLDERLGRRFSVRFNAKF
jgi:outer membrane receptor protein involved in Fe transport